MLMKFNRMLRKFYQNTKTLMFWDMGKCAKERGGDRGAGRQADCKLDAMGNHPIPPQTKLMPRRSS